MAAIKALCLTSLFLIVSRISALQTGNDNKTACESSNVTIDFIFNIGNDSFADRSWYKNSVIPANRIARVIGAGSLTVESQYTGRIALSGLGGIILNNVTKTDSGSYLFIIVTDINPEYGTATTTVNVYVNPNASCMPTIEKNSVDNYTCKISDACPGKDSIQAKWGDGSVGVFTCPKTTANTKHKCCPEGDPVTYCNSIGDLCTVFECPGSGTTTTTTTDTTSTTTTITDTTLTTTTDTTSTTTTTTDTTSTATTATDTTSTATTELPPNDTNNISTSKSPTTVLPSNNTDIKVIVPAIVVPCGLLIIVAIVLIVIFCVRRKAGKNIQESPDGMAIQDKGNNIDGWKQSFRHGNNIDGWKQSLGHGNNIDGWKQSFRHGKATDNLGTVYTTPDGFIIYPGPAAISTARSYKDKKYHGVTDQYSRPDPGKHHHQADYIPSTHPSARAYTHRGKNHHVVTDQYSRPYPGNYGNQSVYFPSTYKSARTYAQKGKTYEGHQPESNPIANSRLAYDQPAYYPQTGYYGQSGQDVYYSGGGQHSYGQRSRSHHDNNGRKQHIDYYSQYEMADYGGNRAGYRHTKQNTAFYY